MEQLSWAAEDAYLIEEAPFTVRATDESFLDMVRPHLGPFRVPDPPEGYRRFSANVGVDRSWPGGKMTKGISSLYLGMLRVYRGRYREEMAGRLMSLVRDLVTDGQDEYFRVRSGAVVVHGQALMLPAAPTPHLGGLVAALVQRGAGYLADAAAKIDPILRRLDGTPLPPMVDESDFSALGLGPPVVRSRPRRDGSETLRPPFPVSVEALGGTRTEAAPLGWIVQVGFSPGEETRLEPAGGAEAVFRFTEAVLNMHVWRERSLTFTRDLLDEHPLSRLTVGSIPEAADLLMRTAPSIMREVTT